MYIISHQFANVNGFSKNKPPFFCHKKKGAIATPFFSILSSFSLLYPTIDVECVFVRLGFSLLLKVCWIVFYTSIAKHIYLRFSYRFRTYGTKPYTLLKAFLRKLSVSFSWMLTCYPHECERFSGFLLPSLLGWTYCYLYKIFSQKKCEVFTPRIHHIIYSFLWNFFFY